MKRYKNCMIYCNALLNINGRTNMPYWLKNKIQTISFIIYIRFVFFFVISIMIFSSYVNMLTIGNRRYVSNGVKISFLRLASWLFVSSRPILASEFSSARIACPYHQKSAPLPNSPLNELRKKKTNLPPNKAPAYELIAGRILKNCQKRVWSNYYK